MCQPGRIQRLEKQRYNHHKSIYAGCSCSPLFAGENNNGDGDANGKKSSMKRIGGRNRRKPQGKAPPSSGFLATVRKKVSGFLEGLPSGGAALLAGLLVLTLLKNLLFGGGGGSDDGFYYYSYSSSSVYETRVNPDGKRETTRDEKSDLKTNIPGLTPQDVLDRGRSTNYFYFDYDE